tara:strand:+ start:223 stop:588 length:366 start_codon:yes stop_codon:yes gene_type:complete
MTNKKNDKKPLEDELKDFKLDPELLKAAEDVEETFAKAGEELKKLTEEMMGLAAKVKEEYEGELDIDALNEMSASITQIHEDSPFLDEIFKGESWKKVIKATSPNIPIKPFKGEDKNEDKK